MASRTRATRVAACPTARAARPMRSDDNAGDARRCFLTRDDDVVSSLLSDRSSLPPNSIALVAHSSPVSSSRSGRRAAAATERTETRRRGGRGGSWRTTSTREASTPLVASILEIPSSSRDASIHGPPFEPLGTSTRSPSAPETRPTSVGGPRPSYRGASTQRPAPSAMGRRSSGRRTTPATTTSTEPPARFDSRHHPTRRDESRGPPSPRWRGPGVGQKSRSAGAMCAKSLNNAL